MHSENIPKIQDRGYLQKNTVTQDSEEYTFQILVMLISHEIKIGELEPIELRDRAST